jgi:hypothetical protein
MGIVRQQRLGGRGEGALFRDGSGWRWMQRLYARMLLTRVPSVTVLWSFLYEAVHVGLAGCNATRTGMLHSNIWEEYTAPTFRTLALLGLKAEAVCSSATLVSTNKSTRHHNPEDQHRHFGRRESIKCNLLYTNPLFNPLGYTFNFFFCFGSIKSSWPQDH